MNITNREKKLNAFERLLTIMDQLRESCPWDRKQTLQSLSHLTVEETYELIDAIRDNNLDNIKEEVGDIMLHLVFYAKISEEKQAFDIGDIINANCDKLVARHPHIYGELKVRDEAEVKKNWEQLKLKEGKKSILGGVPKSLPALIKAYRIQDKTAQVGFEWSDVKSVWDKVEEEIDELKDAIKRKNQDDIELEFGDVLFSLINYARFLNVDPEAALSKVNQKFISRFQYIERQATKPLNDMSLEEMDNLWNQAKTKELKNT